MFDWFNKKEKETGWDPEDEEYDPDGDYEDESEFDTLEEAINSIITCDCPNCGKNNVMRNVGNNFFECSKCGYMEDGELTVDRLGIW